MSNNDFKKISLIVVAVLLLILYYYLDNSEAVKNKLEMIDQYRIDEGFGTYSAIGLIKLTSLTSAITIILVAFFTFIYKRTSAK